MRSIGTLLLVLALAGLPALVQAQRTPPPGGRPQGAVPQASGQIVGSVVSAADGAPLASASVEVRRAADASLVTGAITGPEGEFRIEGLRPGRYLVRVSAVGFETTTRTGITLTPADPRVELGAVRLSAGATEIEGLTVTGERRAASLAPDRNVYDVGDMPAAVGGSTVDVLRNVPALEVDIDGRVSLRGNENVVVQINGRPSPMRGEQLGSFLAQLPASMVERVEVIPNPSARYDPEGMAGIVNVVLRQNTDLGTSGGLTVGGGTTGRLNLSGNLGYQRGPLTLFGSYGFMDDERPIEGSTFRVNRFRDPLTYLEQESRGEMSPLSHSLNLSGDYRLGRRDAVSSNLVLSRRGSDRENLNLYRELDAERNLTKRFQRLTESESDDLTLDYALSYRHVVRPRQDEFSTELRLDRSVDDELELFTQRGILPDGTPAATASEMERNETDQRTRNWSLRADLTRPLGGDTRLETGYKGTLRRLDNDFRVARFDSRADAFLPDLGRSNEFAYDERVHALYGVLSHTAGALDVQGGLRLERASTRFDLATTGESFENGYGSFFPSALVAYDLSEERQLKASYSRRVERPRTRMLNPFARFADPLNVFRGNPALRPEYTHAFEVGYQHSGARGTLQVTPFYRRTTDAVRRIQTLEDDGVTTTTFRNVATSDSYGADLTGSLRLGRLGGFGGVSAFRVVTDATNVDSGLSGGGLGWSARLNGTYRVTRSLDVQGFLMYRAAMRSEQGRTSGRSMLNLAARQRLFGDRASLNLRVVDPFGTMGFGFVTDLPRFYQETDRSFGARGAFLSFSWTFGQQPRRRDRPEQPEVPRDELEIP